MRIKVNRSNKIQLPCWYLADTHQHAKIPVVGDIWFRYPFPIYKIVEVTNEVVGIAGVYYSEPPTLGVSKTLGDISTFISTLQWGNTVEFYKKNYPRYARDMIRPRTFKEMLIFHKLDVVVSRCSGIVVTLEKS